MLVLEPIFLARIQYAFTVSFHILFPAFTIGIASWLAVVEGLWLKTRNPLYQEIYKMWVKIFAVCFGIGVVSGVVMAFQFGTNWSLFSDKVSNVIGPLLGFEVLTAFFLESSFLGIMLFGWGRVSERMHFASTCIVAIGTIISAFWILSANSWMQTPQGFEIAQNGLYYPKNWFAIIFSPSFPYRFFHMLIAAYLTTAFAVAGVAAYYLLKQKYVKHAKIMLTMAMWMAAFVAPLQLVLGDLHGLNTLKYQPQKVAAMEGIWENEKAADLRLFAIIDEKGEKNRFELKVPYLAGLILTHGFQEVVPGLKAFPKENRPPVAVVFWSFRIMVGLGFLMIFTGLIAAFLHIRKKLYETKWFLKSLIWMSPSGFIGVLAGWFVTETGRQPYTVFGILRTTQSISPVIAEQIALTLLAFVLVYSVIFSAACYYIFRLIQKGPAIGKIEEEFYDHSLLAAPISKGQYYV